MQEATLGTEKQQLDAIDVAGKGDSGDRCRMPDAKTIEGIRGKFLALSPVMDERMRRQWAPCEATAFGWGGVSAVAKAMGLAWNSIKAGSTRTGRAGGTSRRTGCRTHTPLRRRTQAVDRDGPTIARSAGSAR